MGDAFNVEKMIRSINGHAPTSRRSILDIIDGGDNTYKSKDGSTFEIDKDEVIRLAEYCSEADKLRLRLPIIVSTDTTGNDTAWKVDGETESKITAKILDKPQYRNDTVRFYHPDYRELMRKFPTTFVVLYLS